MIKMNSSDLILFFTAPALIPFAIVAVEDTWPLFIAYIHIMVIQPSLLEKSKAWAPSNMEHQEERCIFDIDVQGARSVRASSPEAIFIFICPPSFEEPKECCRARGTETEERIQTQLRGKMMELSDFYLSEEETCAFSAVFS